MKEIAFETSETGGFGMYRFNIALGEALVLAKLLNLNPDYSSGSIGVYKDEFEDILVEPYFGVSFSYAEDEDYGFKSKVDAALINVKIVNQLVMQIQNNIKKHHHALY